MENQDMQDLQEQLDDGQLNSEEQVDEECKQSEEQESLEKDSFEKDSLEKEGKKSFKKKSKAEKADKKADQIAELEDKVRRQMAEFDNFRKRTEREKESMFAMGAKSVIEKMLPVIDNFERGLQAAPKGGSKDSFVEGMDMVYRQMLSEFEKIGVKPIKAIGEDFDPNYHNAVMHIEDEAYGDSEIVEEFQKGYLYQDSVIRHSMVKVAN